MCKCIVDICVTAIIKSPFKRLTIPRDKDTDSVYRMVASRILDSVMFRHYPKNGKDCRFKPHSRHTVPLDCMTPYDIMLFQHFNELVFSFFLYFRLMAETLIKLA